uniref:Uncharacterized protein n=1 Tax=Arcella intermedia TaxID=1963864 RepID=A0A6B2LUD0_9EUKA
MSLSLLLLLCVDRQSVVFIDSDDQTLLLQVPQRYPRHASIHLEPFANNRGGNELILGDISEQLIIGFLIQDDLVSDLVLDASLTSPLLS